MLSDAVSLWFSHLLLEFGEVNPGGPTMDNQPLLSILPVRAAQPSVVSGQHEAGGYSQAPSCRTASASQCFVWPGLGKGGWNWNGLLLAYTDVLKKTKKKKNLHWQGRSFSWTIVFSQSPVEQESTIIAVFQSTKIHLECYVLGKAIFRWSALTASDCLFHCCVFHHLSLIFLFY